MRTLLLVMVASFARACVMEEPVGALAGVSWSEADIEIEHEAPADPEVEPITWYPICVDHFVCCQDTKLGTADDAPKKSRCAFCSEICHKAGQGHWPDRTNAGRDCHYGKPKYRLKKPDPECVGLPR